MCCALKGLCQATTLLLINIQGSGSKNVDYPFKVAVSDLHWVKKC